jgi:hypothetical protein
MFVDDVDGHDTFTNRRAHPPDRSISHVATCKCSEATCLDREKAMTVQPLGLCLGRDENEWFPSVQSPTVAGQIVLDDE